MLRKAATEIKPLGNETHHYWLAVAMAKAAGVDLQQALEDGQISHQDWAGLVTRCRGCDWEREGGCGRWLKLALDDAATAEVPDLCANQSAFERIHSAAAPVAG